MNADTLWELAGPRVFARGVADAVRERFNVLVPTFDSSAPWRLGAGLKAFLGLTQQYVCLSDTGSPASLEALQAGWGSGKGDTMHDYCRSVGSLVLILVLKPKTDLATWAEFIMRWQNITRQIPIDSRPCIVVIGYCTLLLKSRLRADVALKILEWDGSVTVADIESLALAEMRRDFATGTVRKVLARIVAEVAQGDASLTTYLARRPPSEIAWPLEAVRCWVADQNRQQLPVPDEIWFEGAMRPHPARFTQAGDGSKAVRDWVWRAQASVILPWVDVHRKQNLHRVAGRLTLQNAFGETVNSVDELEVGEIAYQLGRTGPRDAAQRYFNRLKNLRNRMAHRDPLNLNELNSEVSFIEGNF